VVVKDLLKSGAVEGLQALGLMSASWHKFSSYSSLDQKGALFKYQCLSTTLPAALVCVLYIASTAIDKA